MKVILAEDIEKIGKIGDTVTVADGYGRNYLLPRKLAVMADTKNVKRLEHQKSLVSQKQKKLRDTAERIAQAVEALSLTVTVKVGDQLKLFGSVTAKDLHEHLAQENIIIPPKSILLEEPIKSLGIYSVDVKVHPERTAKLKVWVVAQ